MALAKLNNPPEVEDTGVGAVNESCGAEALCVGPVAAATVPNVKPPPGAVPPALGAAPPAPPETLISNLDDN